MIESMMMDVTLMADTAEELQVLLDGWTALADRTNSEIEVHTTKLGNSYGAVIKVYPSPVMMEEIMTLYDSYEGLRGEKDELDTPDIPASNVGWGSDEVVD